MGGKMPWRSIGNFTRKWPRRSSSFRRTADIGVPFGVQVLQRADADFSALQRGKAFRSGTGGGQRRDRWNAGRHGGAADRFFVEPRLESRRGIDDELNALSFDEVDDVRTPFFYFVDAFHIHAGGLDHVGGTGGSDQLESHVHKFAGQPDRKSAV